MGMYADDYGIVDTSYIVHACMIDFEPCEEHPDTKSEYLIGLLLHVGQGHQCSISYPQRSLRNMAFEQIVALVKREMVEVDDDEED